MLSVRSRSNIGESIASQDTFVAMQNNMKWICLYFFFLFKWKTEVVSMDWWHCYPSPNLTQIACYPTYYYEHKMQSTFFVFQYERHCELKHPYIMHTTHFHKYIFNWYQISKPSQTKEWISIWCEIVRNDIWFSENDNHILVNNHDG